MYNLNYLDKNQTYNSKQRGGQVAHSMLAEYKGKGESK